MSAALPPNVVGLTCVAALFAAARSCALALGLALLTLGAFVGLGATAALAQQGDKQMLVRADSIEYDYTNERVAAVGHVQLYYDGATIEADRVIYDQKTKRLHAEGNVRIIEKDGSISYGQIIDLTDDMRDGFVDSIRAETPDRTRMAAARAERTGGKYTVFESGVYTACLPCKDDPKKPPLWQVKSARMIHDKEEKMVYFEDARIEFFGMPMAWFPYFSMPDPTVKRKTGFLFPAPTSSTVYGPALEVPYFWALAPDKDVTLSPMITQRQGLLMKSEWRQRLLTGSYNIRTTGIFQLDKTAFQRTDGTVTPGYRDWRGSVETNGLFALSDKWVWGWAGTILSDRTYFQDYGMLGSGPITDLAFNRQTEAVSQLYLAGRGNHSYFDARAQYFYGFSELDNQKQIPVIHPVVDHYYRLSDPLYGGELQLNTNFTSLSREQAEFDAIATGAACNSNTADPAAIPNPMKCVMRGVPGTYTRLSSIAEWRRRFVDPIGEVFTPFVSIRGDAAAMQITNEPGVSNFITPGDHEVARFMPTAGVEYRYPFVSTQNWGTTTIEPIAQLIVRPNETNVGQFPNEDAQTLLFTDANLFSIDKFPGYDRVEGGGRANVGVQVRTQFNHAGAVSLLFGQSYSLFGQNSFQLADPTGTGLDSGLDKPRSDYVAGASYQPTSNLTLTTRYRLDEATWDVRMFELQAAAGIGRVSGSVLYGEYAAQPQLGLLTARKGLLGTGGLALNEYWSALGGARWDLVSNQLTQTTIGLSYIDDCLTLALSYVTDYTFSGNAQNNHTILVSLGLRTIGQTSVSTSTSGLGQLPGAGQTPVSGAAN